MPCRHHDVQVFDGMRCCLACGETVFDSISDLNTSPSHEGFVPYKYAPLNYALGHEIRLVVVFPGGPSDDIHLDVIHVNLTDNPGYEAVSYAWATEDGDASLSQTVYCRGRSIAITKTCEAALKCFRRRGRNRTLWIDAISIDQSNIPERNHQVSFMGTIYSRASQVLIYLGLGSQNTDVVLGYLNGETTTLSRFEEDHRGGKFWLGLDHVIREVLRLRWFDRVWVLQEIALAKLATVTAGGKTARWTHNDCITTLLRICRNMEIEPPSALHWQPASEPHAEILTVLHKSRNCSSTDPRDKVFAVLGLAHEKYQVALPVDYSQTAEEVFMKLAVHLIENERSLAVMKHVTGHINMPDKHTLPSWVPRWDVKVRYDPLPPQFTVKELDMLMSVWFTYKDLSEHEDTKQEYLNALKNISKFALLEEGVWSTEMWRQWLTPRWHLIQAKENLSTSLFSSTDLEATALSLTQLQARDFHFAIIPCSSAPSLRELYTPQDTPKWPCLRVRAHKLDTIKSDFGNQSEMTTRVYSRTFFSALSTKRLCASCEAHFVATPICQQYPSVAHTIDREFSRQADCLGKGKKLFWTNQGIGFAHVETAVGDGVWALDGADVPFILRKIDDHYLLLGECYLYRALQSHPCICCGWDVEPWTISTEIIDIW